MRRFCWPKRPLAIERGCFGAPKTLELAPLEKKNRNTGMLEIRQHVG
jgi:hypothetical protein